jgi:hypothetical protein
MILKSGLPLRAAETQRTSGGSCELARICLHFLAIHIAPALNCSEWATKIGCIQGKIAIPSKKTAETALALK